MAVFKSRHVCSCSFSAVKERSANQPAQPLTLVLCLQWSDHKYYTALREVEVLGYLPSPSEVRQFVRHQKACCSSPYSREAVEQVQPPQPQGLSEAASMLTAEQRAHESMCLFSAIEQLPLVDQPPDSGIAV